MAIRKNNKNKSVKAKARLLKGFRDFLPDEMRVREFVVEKLKATFEEFGYEPLETPTLEYQDILLGKYGEQADRLVYTFKDKGGREVGLRYDLTVPVSRVLAMYQDKLVLPFKRYQIQSVFRAEKPQRGRYREFTQCDIDSFGVKSSLADAEIIAVIYKALRRIGLDNFVIKINSRQVLNKILDGIEARSNDNNNILQTLDKLQKIGEKGVLQELEEKGIEKKQAASLLAEVKRAKPDEFLVQVLRLVELFGVPKQYFEFDPSMVRGLDYYTGPIYETCINEPKIGSITGGGRYDNLIRQLGGPDVPATGTTLGLDRICEVVGEQGVLKDRLSGGTSRVLVAAFPDALNYNLKLFSKLQEKGVKAQIYLDPAEPLRGQIAYASKKKIPYVYIAGVKEAEAKTVTVKDMEKGTQEEVSLDSFVTNSGEVGILQMSKIRSTKLEANPNT